MAKEFRVVECFLMSWNFSWIRKMVKKESLIGGKKYEAIELELS